MADMPRRETVEMTGEFAGLALIMTGIFTLSLHFLLFKILAAIAFFYGEYILWSCLLRNWSYDYGQPFRRRPARTSLTFDIPFKNGYNEHNERPDAGW